MRLITEKCSPRDVEHPLKRRPIGVTSQPTSVDLHPPCLLETSPVIAYPEQTAMVDKLARSTSSGTLLFEPVIVERIQQC